MTVATTSAALCGLIAALAATVARPGSWFDRRDPSVVVESFESRFRLERRTLPNVLAVLYTFASYVTGFALLVGPPGWRWAVGGVLVSHAMIAALYLEHECIHALVARTKRWNAVLGSALGWINGRIYFRFDELMHMHLQHHHKVCDFEGFDVAALVSRPRRRRVVRVVVALEAIHVPILHFVIRAHGLGAALRRGGAARRRMLAILAVRLSVFAGLATVAPQAVLGYLVAYLMFVHVVRLVDVFQHAYPERRELPAGTGRRDRYLEQSMTFSLPLAHRFRSLNTLILNFGYHSAHHAFMRCPWYDLPAVHRVLVTDPALRGRRTGATQRVPFAQILRFYHRHRIARLTHGQGTAWSEANTLAFDRFYGAFTDKLGFLDPERSGPSSAQGVR
jgi:fatty acid desaturase